MKGAKKQFLDAKKVSHPNSRKSLAIIKKAKRKARIGTAHLHRERIQSLLINKLLWIKEHMLAELFPYTPELFSKLIEMYIGRNDAELEQIEIKRAIGPNRKKQHESRYSTIKSTKQREQEEYNTCGIEFPNLLNRNQCELLLNWNGEERFLTQFKFIKFGKKHLNEAVQLLKEISLKERTGEESDFTRVDKSES